MPTNYTFKFSFLNSLDPNAGMNVVYTGTLTLNVADPSAVSGTLNFDSIFTQPLDIEGASAGDYQTGTLVNASGSSSEAQIDLSFIFAPDGSAGGGNDSLLGGMVSLLDFSAQETNPYIIQAVAPQV